MEQIKSIKIDLDLPPESRYAKLCVIMGVDNLKEKFKQMYQSYIGIIPLTDFLLESMVRSNIDTIMYRDEIEFWSNTIGLPFYKVVMLQLIYEINSGCTTLVSELNSLQTMIRIMDWPCKFLKEITYHGVFYSQGKPIFDAVCWVGSIGIFTARSIKSKYMCALNYRRVNTISMHTIANSYMNTVVAQAWPVSYLLRHMLELGEKYDAVVQTLETCKLISPVYYVISSLKPDSYVGNKFNPCIIQRAPQAHNTICMKSLVQTNCDSIASPDNIMFSKERLDIINKALAEEKKTFESVIKKVCSYPVLNKDTIYISIINAQSFETNIITDYKQVV